MRRLASGIMLTLLLTGMFPSVFNLFLAAAEPPSTEWTQTYGGTSSDDAGALVRTSDGGYAIAGYTNSYGAGQTDAWLVKTDANGNTQWSKTYGGADTDIANALVQTVDGGYALAGYTYSYGAGGADFWLVKADSSGNLQWSKTYGGTKTDIADTLIQTTDGGYALGGMTVSYCIGEADFWLVKTDANGNAQWTHAYGGAVHEEGQSLVQAVDGGYALAGWTNSYGAGADDMWLVKTDSAGNLQWSKTYGETWYDEAYALVRTTDGGYALAGWTCASVNSVGNFYLVKTDGNGNTQWDRTYGYSPLDNEAYALVQTIDGGYALAGRTYPPADIYCDFWLVKTDSTGNQQWDKTCGGADHDIAKALVQTVDGGYTIAGYTYSYGAGSSDFWLVKVSSGLPPPTYTLTITASVGGTTSPALGTYQIGAGGVVSARAFQYSGYQFDHWELDTVNVGSTNPYSVTMNSAHTLRAVFGAASSQRPIASFLYLPWPLNPVIGEKMWFDASQSKGATSYMWDFDDGHTASGLRTSHSYSTPGTYHVNLTAINSNGQADICKTITVKKPVVVLVHGFQKEAFNPDETWNVMKNQLTGAGFEVYVARYAPTDGGTSDHISNYAAKLDIEVTLARVGYNVDKVDIVADGMGGLVARWYIEQGGGDKSVRKLIMLETPNQGCDKDLLPLLLAAGGDSQVDELISNVFASTWGLTLPPYVTWALLELKIGAFYYSYLGQALGMRLYWNSVKEMSSNSKFLNTLNSNYAINFKNRVHYSSLGGWLYDIPWLRAFDLDGVPKETVSGIGDPIAGYHGYLPKNPRIIQRVKEILNQNPLNLAEAYTLENISENDVETQWAISILGEISPNGEKLHEIPISSAKAADIMLVWSGGDLNLTLLTPNGTLIDPSVAEKHPEISYYGSQNLTIKGYIIENPETGIWDANVTAIDIPENQSYAIMVMLDTNITLSIPLSKHQYDPGEPINITATLSFGSESIIGGSINAKILKPDNTTEAMILYDDGLHNDNQTNDGIYANTFTNTSLWGTYYITATANGSVNNEQFAREAFATIWVEQYPDLSLSETDIHFSKETATEGEIVTINATIHNVGEADANNASILFYDGNPANGTLIGECVINITVGEAETASIQWNATCGTHHINALVSPYNEFLELNYTNNIASRAIEVRGHDITILAVTFSKTVVGQTYEMPANVTFENQGSFPENLSVTIHANTTIIGEQIVENMPNETWTTLTLSWNTSGFAKGNYTIWAYASPVENETDVSDNNFTYGIVSITIPGDFNGDFKVGPADFALLAVAYGSTPDKPGMVGTWNPNCDVNDDNKVGPADFAQLSAHYGQHYP